MDPSLRASDADRERAVTALQRHVGDGRITLEEFSQRCAAIYGARTLGDLGVVTADLPREDNFVPARADRAPFPRHRGLVLAALVITALAGAGTIGGLTEAAAAMGSMMDGCVDAPGGHASR